MAQYSVKLIEKKEIASEVLELRYEKPEGFIFEAGQFVQFSFIKEGKPTLRSYSISSIPSVPYLEFCVKLVPGGLGSEAFRASTVGDDFLMQGPQGRFLLNPEATSHTFTATGAGLAPIVSLIEHGLREVGDTKKYTLVFGVRGKEDLFWLERLDALKIAFPNFSYVATLSQPDESWTGSRGRVTEHEALYLSESHFYLCGSAPMIMDMRKILIAKGCDAKKIHFEIF